MLLHADACRADLLLKYCCLVLAFNLDGFLSEIVGKWRPEGLGAWQDRGEAGKCSGRPGSAGPIRADVRLAWDKVSGQAYRATLTSAVAGKQKGLVER